MDVHAIDELQKKGIPPTNDKPKYKYTSDEEGNYGEKRVNIFTSSPHCPMGKKLCPAHGHQCRGVVEWPNLGKGAEGGRVGGKRVCVCVRLSGLSRRSI